MYINAVAASVMLHLQHDFYMIFKIQQSIYNLRVIPPPQKEDFWVRSWQRIRSEYL
jgi:hypothetical protein